jgi:Domain of unknown function (DUF1707)
VRDPRPLIPVVPLAFILPDPLVQPQQRASDADRDTAVDILCAAVAEGRLTLTELHERVGAALSARTICELAALIADLSGRWTPVPASASVGVSPPASPGWASRAPERWPLLQSLADRPVLPSQPRPAARRAGCCTAETRAAVARGCVDGHCGRDGKGTRSVLWAS